MSVGLEIPGVTIGELLGSGGMGSVFAGSEEATGRQVAVKVLGQSRITDASRRRFEREARAMLALRHENVCEAYDFGALDNGRLYLVMERLRGQDLSAALSVQRALSLGEAVRLTQEAARGLAAAHAVGLAHRDVKPSNLFLHEAVAGAPPVVKVVDFGLAVAQSGELEVTRVTRTGEVLGTPAYMAPEQARGDRSIDHRVDIYALGAVLYHMLTGSPPFGRGGTIEILIRALTEAVPSVLERRPDVPTALGQLVHAALARDPDARPQSMAAFLELLGQIEVPEGGSIPAARPPPIDLAIDRRVVTVLIASGVQDIRRVVDAIEGQGGEATVVGAVGQVVGVFGGERSVGDEANRAVRAALASEQHAVSIGVGTGRADGVAGVYVGDVVRAAETLTQVSQGKGVRLDSETYRRTRGHFKVEGDRVIGILDDGEVVRTSPFVGREVELAEITGAAQRAFEEPEAAIVLVTGPPGIGKSRFVQAVTEAVGEALVATARGDTTRRYASWALLGDVVRSLAVSATGHSRPGEALVALAERLGLDPLALDALCAAAGVAQVGRAPVGAGIDAHAMRDRLLIVLGDVLEGLSAETPLLLVAEDIHEADTPSLELLDVVLRRCRTAPVVLLATARDHFTTERPDLFEGAIVRRIVLRELSKRAAISLATSFGLSEAEAQEVATHTGGNPLFVEQVALAARTTGPGGIPSTIEDAVQARLDPLPRPVREGLRAASAFGARFAAVGLDAVGVPDARALVDRLVREDLIAAERRRPDRGAADRSSSDTRAGETYAFRCTLLRDVTYAALTAAQRRDIHSRIGAWLLTSGGSAGDVAHHTSLGHHPADAIPHWLEAARIALFDGDLAAARAGLEHALPVARGTSHEVAVRIARLGVFVRAADVPAARAEVESLAAFAPGDPRARAELAYWRGAIDQWEGLYPESLASFAEAAALFESLGDTLALSRSLAMQAVQICTGRLGDGRPLADQAIVVAGTDASTRARALHTRYYVANYADKPVVARQFGQAALQACEEARDFRRSLEVLTTLAAEELELGLVDAARRRLVDVVARSQRLGNRAAEGYALHNLGVALCRLGQPADAITHQTRAADIALNLRHGRLAGAALYHRALARLMVHDIAGAQDDAEGAVPLVAGSTEEASALTALASVHAATGALDVGLEAVGRARRLWEASGQRPELEAELLACEVELLERSGQSDLARERRMAAVSSLVARAEALTETPEEREIYLMGTPARARLLEGPTQLH